MIKKSYLKNLVEVIVNQVMEEIESSKLTSIDPALGQDSLKTTDTDTDTKKTEPTSAEKRNAQERKRLIQKQLKTARLDLQRQKAGIPVSIGYIGTLKDELRNVDKIK